MPLGRSPTIPHGEPKAFQFIEGQPYPDGHSDKENGMGLLSSQKAAESLRTAPAALHKASSEPFPSTPGARIPLADLIGDAERPHITQAQVESPQEHIEWQTTRSPERSQATATPAPRGKKRAKSSSPPGSSARTKSKRQKPDEDSLNMNSVAKSLKTPANDPATDLWNRYATGTSMGTPIGLNGPAFAHLLDSSSPQVDEQKSGNVKGLRRWTSCGVEWPSSKTKRKVAKSTNLKEELDDVFMDRTRDSDRANEHTKPSKISSMLERIQQSLVREKRSPANPNAPSSSSPIPQRCEVFDRTSISPTRAPELAALADRKSIEQSKTSDTTSFGSEDFGSDILEEVATQEQSRPVENSGHHDNFEDEFGDDEFDAGEFDEVVSLCSQKPQAPTQLQTEQEDEFGFGDEDDIDEASLAAAEVAATQRIQASTTLTKSSVLLVDVENSTQVSKTITLRGSWFDTRCTQGSYVHVIGEFDPLGQIFIDDAHNMLILHPDHLISALVVADSFDCTRRAVLQDRVKATSEASPPMMYGTMIHEIFQEALKSSRWDDNFLRALIANTIAVHIEDLYEVKLSPEHVTEHLLSKMPALQTWCQRFIKEQPSGDGIVQDRNSKQVNMSLSKLLDVEEHIWSPMYGLKGNIDATVQVNMQDDDGAKTLIAPFEIKTGKRPTASHRAQTALYTLLLSDRYDVAIAYGILYYTETSEISRVPAIRHELRHMIMQRNELACYVREKLTLPPMVNDTRKCGHCYAKTSCFLYHRLVENGNGETSGMRDKFDAVTKHLKPAHQEFFRKWDHLLTKEESEIMKFRRELWTMMSIEREKLGRAFANVVLEPGSGSEVIDGNKINRFHYSFHKLDVSPTFSFTESQLTVGEPIVVSDERGHYALAKGYVTGILKTRITVAVDRLLKNARTRLPGFNLDRNQVFSGVTDSAGLEPTISQSSPMLYRLDKDEFSNGMATVRNNLVQIMTEDAFGSRNIRELIVDGKEPVFKAVASAYTLSGPQSQLDINEDQRGAIEKIMCAEDYALVLGMPGTGKTTTIAHIIRALVSQGKSVLLTSYTHTAVDNILLKIKNDNISVLRLGAIAKVHPEVREFATLAAEPRTSIEELRRAYHDPQVVATTCLGIGHRMFNERVFDYCIVDEASQITLPVCVGPIRLARAFVLVGDHFQLPPLVQNKEALEGGLDVSLFKLLSERHPAAVATLRHQYRMNAPIMSLSNALIYEGALVCGTEAIAQSTMSLPEYARLDELHRAGSPPTKSDCPSATNSDCWLSKVLNPSMSTPVVFIDTDTLLPASLESQKASRITNVYEATLITRLSRVLLLAGLPASSLGIITLYRSQLALIKSMLLSSEHGIARGEATEIEAHTADRFQGRDKEAILLSCVRNNDRACVGDLLKDWRRVNVAVTRARRKLIIVGSRGTLSKGDELLSKLVSLCDQNGWTVNLPKEAAEDACHDWLPKSIHQSTNPDIHSSLRTFMKTTPVNNAIKLKEARSTFVNKAFRPPTMAGKLSTKAALGGAKIAKRSVLADIVNEVVPEGFFDD
ncbi:hypothetical protein FH972_022264 [Carpinus fangiana]|uniref:DNA replication ATP-dependent helicase/nuclease n=1 Tax=Carpinus fangiana TaxID=176857 RepID=A0A5N6KTZ0_9ROSI|nr:hypothetical protein FH972_022264 [Carpinus fangiana]